MRIPIGAAFGLVEFAAQCVAGRTNAARKIIGRADAKLNGVRNIEISGESGLPNLTRRVLDRVSDAFGEL
jgi:hypothetical protein